MDKLFAKRQPALRAEDVLARFCVTKHSWRGSYKRCRVQPQEHAVLSLHASCSPDPLACIRSTRLH